MKRIRLLTVLVLVAVMILGCQPAVQPTDPTTAPTTAPTTVPTTAPTTAPTTEPTTEPTEPENLFYWMPEEWESASYEDYFSVEVAFQSVNALDPYFLCLDQEGFAVKEHFYAEDILARIPDTADFASCTGYAHNGRYVYVQYGTQLLEVSLETGERSVLYTADGFRGDLILADRDVLYFLSVSHGILNLNRLYLPTGTLDLLYSQPESTVPEARYFLYAPESNQSPVCWETVNPEIWELVLEIQEDPDHPYRALHPWLENPDVTQMAASRDRKDEYTVQILDALENETNIRARVKMCYDPQTDTITTLYGLYDVCMLSSPVHEESAHWADAPEVTP